MSSRTWMRTVALALLVCATAAAQAPCSLESLRGTWAGMSGVNTLTVAVPGNPQPVPTPAAGLGIFTADEQGRMSGWSNMMLGGQYFDTIVSGQLELSRSCLGTLRFTTKAADGSSLPPAQGLTRFAVVENGNEMRQMTVEFSIGKYTGTETYRRLSKTDRIAPKCTAETVRGTYATAVDGVVIMAVPGQPQPVAVPYSGIGGFAVDTDGSITGGATASVGGQIIQGELVDARIRVMEDCSGYVAYRLRGSPAPAMEKLIILDDGDEIRSLTILGGTNRPVTPGIWKRISQTSSTTAW